MKNRISLVIADDHEIFRDGLALMLSKQEAVTLAGQAGDGEELLRLVDTMRPDMVLTDKAYSETLSRYKDHRPVDV